ncbi:MAG: NAD-dependent epimerase/dehydratase family protein [Nitrososphaeria archaeon]
MDKILITGSTGFIGKELVSKLKSSYEIHTLERYVTGRYSLDSNAINHYANLTDYSAINYDLIFFCIVE